MDQNPNFKKSKQNQNNTTNLVDNQLVSAETDTVVGQKLTNENPPKVRQYVDCDEGWC